MRSTSTRDYMSIRGRGADCGKWKLETRPDRRTRPARFPVEAIFSLRVRDQTLKQFKDLGTVRRKRSTDGRPSRHQQTLGMRSEANAKEEKQESASSVRVAFAISLIVHYEAKLLLLLITCRMSISHDHLVAVVCFPLSTAFLSFLIIEMENRFAWGSQTKAIKGNESVLAR